jgi:hypothetical protein
MAFGDAGGAKDRHSRTVDAGDGLEALAELVADPIGVRPKIAVLPALEETSVFH